MSKTTPPDVDLLRKIARWHWVQHLTCEQIAKELQLEVRQIYKSIDLAEKLGIIRFEFPDIVGSPQEQGIRKRYPKLHEIIVVEAKGGCRYPDLLKEWGEAAASYFDRITNVKGEYHVGITGGLPVLEFCEALGQRKRDNIHIYTTALIGRGPASKITVSKGISDVDPTCHIDPIVNATILW